MSFFKKKSQTPSVSSSSQPHASRTDLNKQSPSDQSSKDQSGEPTGISGVKYLIGVASGKGGVGKSTVSAQLAYSLSTRGYKVGVLDADLYGPSQTQLFGVQPQNKEGSSDNQNQGFDPIVSKGVKLLSMGLWLQSGSPVVWRAPIAVQMLSRLLHQAQWGLLDYLIIDLPPGTGDLQLTLAQSVKLSGVVVVTTPQEVAVGIAQKGLQMFSNLKVPILGIVENMSGFLCSHCGQTTAIFSQGGGMILAKKLAVPFLGSIPLSPEVLMSGEKGEPLSQKDPQAALSIKKIVDALEVEVQKSSSNFKGEDLLRHFDTLEQGQKLLVSWLSGASVSVSAFRLRSECRCASCVDENTGVKTLKVDQIDPNITIKGVGLVGRYGLSIHFSDGHQTGIYALDRIKTLEDPMPHRTAATESAPKSAKMTHTDLPSLEQIQNLLDQNVNPGISHHGGKIEAVSIDGNTVSVLMQGGCQGCGAAQMTLTQGVERAIKQAFPMIEKVQDATKHHEGTNPYLK